MYLDRLEFKRDPLRAIGVDPRCRVLVGVCLITGAISVGNWYLLFALIPLLMAGHYREIKTALRRLIPVNIFNLMLALTLPFGVWINTLSGLPADYGAAGMTALRYVLRINVAALLYMLFIIPLGIGGLAATLSKLAVPSKLVSLLILSYRYIFVLHERLTVSLLSMRLRSPRVNTIGQWRSSAAVFSASIAAAILRSQKIEIAMKERGFNGVFPLTRPFHWKSRDTVMLIAGVVFSLLLYLLGRGPAWIF
jgi:cobalt/nickel transport system permease protein